MEPKLYAAIALKHALRFYDKTGMKPNRAWTPTAMLRKAGEIMDKKYTRGEYLVAADDLEEAIDVVKLLLNARDNGYDLSGMSDPELLDDIHECHDQRITLEAVSAARRMLSREFITEL